MKTIDARVLCSSVTNELGCTDSSCRRDHGTYECELCGNRCEELFTVDDSDRSVGYVSTLDICAGCKENHGS